VLVPLKAPIRTFDISRNEKLGLRLVARSPQDATGGAEPPPANTVQILRNKLARLNDAPQSEITEELLAQLGLRFGEREKRAASKVRNKSAHGKDDEVDVEWIRDLKLVRIRFNRMALAMMGASDWYYDYFTLGWPTRQLPDASCDDSAIR
jgi:hypothetical protein